MNRLSILVLVSVIIPTVLLPVPEVIFVSWFVRYAGCDFSKIKLRFS